MKKVSVPSSFTMIISEMHFTRSLENVDKNCEENFKQSKTETIFVDFCEFLAIDVKMKLLFYLFKTLLVHLSRFLTFRVNSLTGLSPAPRPSYSYFLSDASASPAGNGVNSRLS